MKIEPITFDPITRLQLIKYAGASGDFNPIHTIDEEAMKAGLPGIIAHGMLTMGLMGRLFSPYLDKGMIREFSTRFLRKVFLGDQLTVQASLRQKVDEGQGTVYYFDVSAENQHHEMVAKGSIAFFNIM